MPSPLDIRLLGGLSVTGDRPIVFPTRKTSFLFAYLALHAGGEVSRERIKGLLWSDRGEQQASGSLRRALVDLRKALEPKPGATIVVSTQSIVKVTADAVDVDVTRFQRLVRMDPSEVAHEAAELYQGDLLSDIPAPDPVFEDWLRIERERLRTIAVNLVERLAEHSTAKSTLDAVSELANRLLGTDPACEEAHRALIILYQKAGRKNAAVKQYALCVEALRASLGVEPEDRTRKLLETAHEASDFGGSPAVEGPGHRSSVVAATAEAPSDSHIPHGTPVLTPVSQPSIAILPFETIGEPSLFADGLAHDLITRLGRTRWLFVIARGSAFRFKDSPESPAAIAGKLGVRYVAHGAVQGADKLIRVHTALTDATTGVEVWSEHFDRRRDDLFVIQSEISDAIAGAVESQIEQLERGRSLLKPSESLDAWEAYHRGCWHMFKYLPEHFEEAERWFLRSIELDQSSPRPYSGLSFVHWNRAFLEISKDRAGEIAQAKDLAEQAIALDPRDPQGYNALGRAYLISGDIPVSERELQKAVDLNPSFALGQYSLAFSLTSAGLFEESQEAASQAQRLSPFDPVRFAMMAVKARNLVSLGSDEEAVSIIAQAVEEPNAPFQVLGLAVAITAQAGEPALSAAYLKRLRAIRPGYDFAAYSRAFPTFGKEEIESVKRAFRVATSSP